MSLQWYPGHMTKARRELAEAAPSQQLIIEVLDARLPRASQNPVIAELAPDKPRLCVLTKSDLADPQVTRAWVEHLERTRAAWPAPAALPAASDASDASEAGDARDASEPGVSKRGAARGRVVAIAVSTADPAQTRALVATACKRLGLTLDPKKRVRALIAGVPNVGKSTLVNTLLQRVVAEVADKPAVTKSQKLVVLKSGLALTDTPGILWPKIEDETGALRLAFAGSIPDTAVDYATLAMFGAAFLLARYPDLLVARFRLGARPPSPAALLEELGRRRGALRPGGVVDLHKASEILVREFRSGALGRISLESPQ